MVVFITLTTAGTDTGPFDLYSDKDGFLVPFETDVNKAALEAGYSTVAPDVTTIVRVQSKGKCLNFTDIVLTDLPPLPPVPCGSLASGGGSGITDNAIPLTPEGGIIIVAINPQGVPDKLEIIQGGIKRATSSMSATTGTNSGPFDDVYGTPPTNTFPANAGDVSAIPQFIGSSKGTVPNRNAEFLSVTGITGITAGANTQLIWWTYTPVDYVFSQNVIVRVTGTSGTGWSFTRECPPSTSTTSSSTSTTTQAPTTSTTTTAPVFQFLMSDPWTNTGTACSNVLFPKTIKTTSNPIVVGSIIRNNIGSGTFAGGGWWYEISGAGFVIQINGSGVVIGKFTCS